MNRKSSDIAAYTYQAEILCPVCVLRALPTGEDEPFDGWADMRVPPMSAEDNLNELAAAFGFNRFDESSYDSGDFPKVVFVDMIEDGGTCDGCGDEL